MTIRLVKDAFPSLQQVPQHHIGISSYLAEFNDTLRITKDLWPDLMSRLMTVHISLIGPEGASAATGAAAIEHAGVSPNSHALGAPNNVQ